METMETRMAEETKAVEEVKEADGVDTTEAIEVENAREDAQNSIFVSEVGSYGIFVPVRMYGTESEHLALAWAQAVIADLGVLGKPNLLLTIGEARCAERSYNWQASIMRRQENGEPWAIYSDLSPRKIYELRAGQYYIARNSSNPEENYAGTIDLSIEAFRDRRMSLILRLAAAHYYEQICRLYPAYETDYLNSLRYTVVEEAQSVVVRP